MSEVVEARTEESAPALQHDPERHRHELRKEAMTMGLYVAVCLLATMLAVDDHSTGDHPLAFGLVWGTTLGLAAAHWFAFRLSAKYVASGTAHRADAELAAAQFLGAAAVAVLATVPILLLPGEVELDVVRLDMAVFITAVGFAVSRSTGASRGRSIAYGFAVLILAFAVALLKNALTH